MAEKLKSALQNLYQRHRSQSLLFLKAVIFGFSLLIVALRDFRLLPILFFIAISCIMYAGPLFGSYSTRCGFLALIISSILGIKIAANSILLFPTLFLFSFVFYLILGIKDFLFVKRSRLYFIAMMLLFYAIFVIFFLSDKSELYLLEYGGVILASFLLFREWLALISSFHFPKREIIASAVASLIIAQMLWVVALLPVGFISASNFMILLVLVLGNFLFRHFTGGISKTFLIQHLIFFLLLAALIFGTSMWSLG